MSWEVLNLLPLHLQQQAAEEGRQAGEEEAVLQAVAVARDQQAEEAVDPSGEEAGDPSAEEAGARPAEAAADWQLEEAARSLPAEEEWRLRTEAGGYQRRPRHREGAAGCQPLAAVETPSAAWRVAWQTPRHLTAEMAPAAGRSLQGGQRLGVERPEGALGQLEEAAGCHR